MELYDIYDAEDHELVAELQRLKRVPLDELVERCATHTRTHTVAAAAAAATSLARSLPSPPSRLRPSTSRPGDGRRRHLGSLSSPLSTSFFFANLNSATSLSISLIHLVGLSRSPAALASSCITLSRSSSSEASRARSRTSCSSRRRHRPRRPRRGRGHRQ